MKDPVIKIIVIISVVVIISSCKQPGILSDEEKQTAVQEVKTTLQNYYADIKKSGLTAEFKYLDSSSNFFWVPPGYSAALSYDTISAIIKRNAVACSLVDNSFETLSILPLSKELATYTGRLRSFVKDTSGHSNSFLLVETGVMVKKGNDWKLLCGQTNLLQPENK